MKKFSAECSAFSLMEVNIAVALVSVGLLAVFSLFPIGLRESDLSVSDSHEAMFANHILSAMESNALQIDDWEDWSKLSMFTQLVCEGINPRPDAPSEWDLGQGVAFPVSDDSGKVMRYKMDILTISGYPAAATGQRSYLIQLRAKSGKYGDFDTYCNTYAAVVTYMGSQ